jgi:hypothetical protein
MRHRAEASRGRKAGVTRVTWVSRYATRVLEGRGSGGGSELLLSPESANHPAGRGWIPNPKTRGRRRKRRDVSSAPCHPPQSGPTCAETAAAALG